MCRSGCCVALVEVHAWLFAQPACSPVLHAPLGRANARCSCFCPYRFSALHAVLCAQQACCYTLCALPLPSFYCVLLLCLCTTLVFACLACVPGVRRVCT